MSPTPARQSSESASSLPRAKSAGDNPIALLCRAFTSFADASALVEAWERLALETGASVYMTPDWCRVWWEHYGRGRSLQILAFHSGGELVAVVPLFCERIWLGPVQVKICKLVGSDFTLALCDPPVRARHLAAVFQEVIRRSLAEWRCDLVRLAPLSGSDPATDAALREAAARSDGEVAILDDQSPGPHIEFTLPGSFEGYIQSLDKRQRGNYRRDRNLLDKSFTVRSDVVVDGATLSQEFDRFRAMHDEQWQAEGKLGHFGDWPGSDAFHRTLIQVHAARDRVRLVRLAANDRVVSYQLCFRFGPRCYWRLPARVVGSEWNRFGLGRMGLIQLIERMIPEGITHVEAGVGHYDYKIQLGGQEHPVRSLLLVARRATARLRCRLFLGLARALHLLYYRIWFQRVAPRLPLPRRPLWRIWIRSRL